MTAETAVPPDHAPAPTDAREVEWQLAAPDLGSVRRWLHEHASIDGLSLEPCATLQIQDVYLDTEDWGFFRAGYALRARRQHGRSEVTLKSLHSAREDRADRREITQPLRSSEHFDFRHASGPVASRVQAVLGTHPLRPLFEVRTRRERFAIRRGAAHEMLGEIALDESVIVRRDSEPAASLRRVEVESLGEPQKPLERLVERLRAECALEPAPQSKYELGLRSMGLDPTTVPGLSPVAIEESMGASEVALARLRGLLNAWLAHEPGARLGDDPERLHDLRAAARSIEVTLGLFAEYLPRPLVRARRRVKTLIHAFGAVRDLDVQLEELARFSHDLPEADRHALEPLVRHLDSERTQARSRMLRSLDSEATRRWLENTMTLLAQPGTESLHDGALAVAVAPLLIEERFRKLRKAYRGLTDRSSMEEYHAVRRRAKKLRYTIESLAPIYGKPAEQMLRSVHRLQDALGRQRDAHVMQQRLLALASAPLQEAPPRTLFLMGRLAERCTETGAGARERLAKRWRKASGRRWKNLRAQMRAMRARSPRTIAGAKADSATGREVAAHATRAGVAADGVGKARSRRRSATRGGMAE